MSDSMTSTRRLGNTVYWSGWKRTKACLFLSKSESACFPFCVLSCLQRIPLFAILNTKYIISQPRGVLRRCHSASQISYPCDQGDGYVTWILCIQNPVTTIPSFKAVALNGVRDPVSPVFGACSRGESCVIVRPTPPRLSCPSLSWQTFAPRPGRYPYLDRGPTGYTP